MPQETFSTLVTVIATAFVDSIDTPAWPDLRHHMIGLLGHGDADRVRLAAEHVDATRSRLAVAAPADRDAVAEKLVGEWRGLLRLWAAEHPVAAAELLALRREFQELTASGKSLADHDDVVVYLRVPSPQ
jgi:hypothetical protein